MLSVEFLYKINEAVIVLTLFVVLLAVTEIGYRHGRAVSEGYGAASKAQLSTLQAAILGLLALLLAFSFAMAESRFEVRRALVVDESNAIGSVYLRSQMLPDPYRGDIAKLLRDYVEARIRYFAPDVESTGREQANHTSVELQKALWDKALVIAHQDPAPVPPGLFITSLNEVFDVYGKRESARENHVPEVVLWLLFFVTIGAMEFVGYVCGVEQHRGFSRTFGIAVLLSLVILVMIDLDRPRRGLIEVSQRSMLQLRETLRSATSPPP